MIFPKVPPARNDEEVRSPALPVFCNENTNLQHETQITVFVDGQNRSLEWR